MYYEEETQASHYKREKNQYDFNLILHPPLHTQEEIDFLLNQLKDLGVNRGSVVDFGSGAGRLTIPLLQNRFHVNAVDISKESLFTLKKRVKKLNLSGLKTSLTLPENGSFQAVVGTDILHHIKLDDYLPKLRKSLKKNGVIIFSEPNALNISWYIYLPLFQSWKVEKGVLYNSYFNLKKKLTLHGFRDVKLIGFGLFPRPICNVSISLCKFNDSIGNLPILKMFAYRFFVVARR